MAAAQNVRSGSSPVPTHDPDLRSRPFERIWSRPLIQTWYNVLVSWCLVQWWLHVIGFPALQLFTLPSSQATNCCKVTLPKLSSFQAAAKQSSSPAAKLQLFRIQAVKLPSWHCCKLYGQPAKQPSCTLAAFTPCRPFLVLLHPSCNIHKHVGPLLGRSRPDPDHNHNQLRPRPHPAPC